MEDLRTVVAGNIAGLRFKAGMKQAELAEKINYSDKAISKWERAESLPDVSVLKSISDVFGVTLDYMVTDHRTEISKKETEETNESSKNGHDNALKPGEESDVDHLVISLIVTVGIISLAVALFFIISPFSASPVWYVLPAGVATACVPLIVFNALWGKRALGKYIILCLVISLLAVLYLIFIKYNIWMIFLLSLPAAVIIWLSFRVKKTVKSENTTLQGVE